MGLFGALLIGLFLIGVVVGFWVMGTQFIDWIKDLFQKK